MEATQLNEYVAVLMLIVAVIVTGGMLGLSILLGRSGQRSQIKDTAYECGMVPVSEV